MFGGVSGSAVADASALGNALIPVQKSEGYSGGLPRDQLASSTVAVLIPPSIPLILYGLVANARSSICSSPESCRLMLGVGCSSPSRSWRVAATFARRWKAALRRSSQIIGAIPALLMPVFIIVDAALRHCHADRSLRDGRRLCPVGQRLIYRDLTRASVGHLVETGMMTGAVMLIIMGSSVIQWVLTAEACLRTSRSGFRRRSPDPGWRFSR